MQWDSALLMRSSSDALAVPSRAQQQQQQYVDTSKDRTATSYPLPPVLLAAAAAAMSGSPTDGDSSALSAKKLPEWASPVVDQMKNRR